METSGIYLDMAGIETEVVKITSSLETKYSLLQVKLTGHNTVRAVTTCTATGESCAQMGTGYIDIGKRENVVEVTNLPEQPCAKGCLFCSKNPTKSASVQL